VSHYGRYTETRLQALAAYSKRTSALRVLAVLVATPLPILCFVVGMECVPLAKPSRGWSSNYVWWIRHTLCLVLMTMSVIAQVKTLIPGIQFSRLESLGIVAGTNIGYIGFLISLASSWAFPIPFVFALTGGLFSVLLVLMCMLALESRKYRCCVHGSRASSSFLDTDSTRRFSSFKLIVVIETMLASLYPAFERSFLLVDAHWQLVFPILLVVIKTFLKHLMALSIRRGKLETQLPELIVFSIELFHSLYLTTCFSAKSITIWWMIVVIVIDFMQSLSSVYALLRHATSVQQLFNYNESNRRRSSLLDSVMEAIANKQARRGPSFGVFASLRTVKRMLTMRIGPMVPQEIAPAPSPPTRVVSVKSVANRRRQGTHPLIPQAIGADPLPPTRAISVRSGSSRSRRGTCSRLLLTQQTDETLRVFSKSEYFIFVEYVECIIPLIYVLFHAFLARLPNAQYYSTSPTTSVGVRSLFFNVGLFVSIKVISLVAFSLYLRHRVRFFMLHQLAFALEAEMVNIQAKFAIFIPYCLFFFLAHNGESRIVPSNALVCLAECCCCCCWTLRQASTSASSSSGSTASDRPTDRTTRPLAVKDARVELVVHGLDEVEHGRGRVRVLDLAVLLLLEDALERRAHLELRARRLHGPHKVEPRGGAQHVSHRHEQVHALALVRVDVQQRADGAEHDCVVHARVLAALGLLAHGQQRGPAAVDAPTARVGGDGEPQHGRALRQRRLLGHVVGVQRRGLRVEGQHSLGRRRRVRRLGCAAVRREDDRQREVGRLMQRGAQEAAERRTTARDELLLHGRLEPERVREAARRIQ
jgi:hypothetical protein